jgi:opacity protein-like surface antigen
MRRLLASTVAAAGLALAAAAVAAPPPGPRPPPRIFLSPSGEPFRLASDMPDPLQAWFDGADTGHLGYLDRAEFRADAARFFKKLDENSDGVVDGFEVQDYETKMVPELADWSEGIGDSPPAGSHSGDRHGGHRGEGGSHGDDRGGDDGQGGGDHPGGRQPRGQRLAQLINEPEPVTGADFSFDSHITLAEWTRATDQRFDLLDKAKTGKLTLVQLRALISPPPRSPAAPPSPPPPPPSSQGRFG